jgi:hypothetical protein
VVEASVLIICANPAPRVNELDDWIAKTASELDPAQAALYRSRREQTPGPDVSEGEVVWSLALSDAIATGPRIRGLVAEMRLLGLSPVVYRPGSLPRANEGLARVF